MQCFFKSYFIAMSSTSVTDYNVNDSAVNVNDVNVNDNHCQCRMRCIVAHFCFVLRTISKAKCGQKNAK